MALITWAIDRSEEHTSELQSPLNISYAVFCLKKKKFRLFRADRCGLRCRARFLDVLLCFLRHACDFSLHFLFFFNDTAPTEIYTLSDTLSLHDALPILIAIAGAFVYAELAARRPEVGG